jgi:molecular chaperone GrpE
MSHEPEATPPSAETTAAADVPPEGAQATEAPAVDPRAEELARVREQLQRTAADFDNYRKRARREVEDAQRRGGEEMLKELLPVFDNLERAGQHAGTATDVKAVADGVRMVLKQFVDTLGRAGIRRVPAVGAPFDPSFHEAIQQVESAEHPAGTIVAEVQPGYAFGEKLVRAAMVVVAKPPAARPAEPPPGAEPGGEPDAGDGPAEPS